MRKGFCQNRRIGQEIVRKMGVIFFFFIFVLDLGTPRDHGMPDYNPVHHRTVAECCFFVLRMAIVIKPSLSSLVISDARRGFFNIQGGMKRTKQEEIVSTSQLYRAFP